MFIAFYDGMPPYDCNFCPLNMRESRGCEKEATRPLKLDPIAGHQGHEYVFETCPVHYVDPTFNNWFVLYGLFKRNMLLVPGGVGDQPAKYMDAMLFIERYNNIAERMRLEEAKPKK